MSWKAIKELKENRAKVFADAQALRDTANKEGRDLNADEETRHAGLLTEVETIGKRIEREERAAALGESIAENRSMIGRDAPASILPEKDMRRYSVLRAIQKKLLGQPLDGVEAEVNAEIERRTGKRAQGFYLPTSLRALDTTAGTGSIMTTTDSSVIDLLRNRLVVNGLGANILSDMQGKFALPRQTAGATAYWLGESGAPTGSNQTLDQVLFSPKTVGAFTDISRQFVNQTSADAEQLVLNDLAKVLAIAIDTAALAGTGANNQPTGILSASGVGTVAYGTNGGAPTWANIVKMETTVANANADLAGGKFAYVTNSKVRGVLKTTDKTTGGYGQFVWDANDKVNGYNTAVTNSVPFNGTKGTGTNLSSIIYGNFNELVIAMWGALDITVDPYTGSSSGTVRIVALQDVDIQLRHAASFCISTDVIA